MTKNKRETNGYGLVYLLFVLSNIIALRESYTGNPEWYLVHLLTFPLLLLYIFKVYQSRGKRESEKKPIGIYYSNKIETPEK